jgi:hypothetical protein
MMRPQVTENKVRGWDDPRLATINGLRRRGYTPEAINAFCRDIGVSRSENIIMTSRLEFHLREHLDVIAKRAFAVLRPLKVTLLDFPEGEVRWLEAPDFPRDKALGSHRIALSRVVYIEQDDFRCVFCAQLLLGGVGGGGVAGDRWEIGCVTCCRKAGEVGGWNLTPPDALPIASRLLNRAGPLLCPCPPLRFG